MGLQWRLPLILTFGLLCAGFFLLADSNVATRRSFKAARSLLRGANFLETKDERARLHTDQGQTQQQQQRQQQERSNSTAALHKSAGAAAAAGAAQGPATEKGSAGLRGDAAPQQQQQQQQKKQEQQQQPPAKQKAAMQQRCAIYNGVRFHLDVTAGLAWAFQEAGCKTDLYLHNFRLGLEDVLGPWFRGRVQHKDELDAAMGQYDLVVMATYPELASTLDTQHSLIVQRRPGQRILLTVHNPRLLLESAGALAPLTLMAQHAAGEQGQGTQQAVQPVQLLALSPCSASYSSSLYGAWAADMASWMPSWEAPTGKTAKPEVPWIVPLVPWAPANETKGGKGLASRGEGEYRGPLAHFCIQGNIDPERRNYDAAFQAAMHPAVLSQLRRRGEQLLLVGAQVANTADLEVPAQLRDHVQLLTDLNYEQYYETLSRCRAILTAFGSELYLLNKTSSSMAAALLVGTPLLTEDRVLGAYQYVPGDAAFAYRSLLGDTWPDPAALATTEGIRQSRLLHKLVTGGRQGMGRRRLIEGPAALAAAGQRLAQVAAAAEDDWEEGQGFHWPADEQQDGSSVSVGSNSGSTNAGSSSSKPQPRRWLAAKEQPTGKRKPEGKKGQQDSDQPPVGSYAAALLQALDDKASRAAHTAAWRAKRAAMQRNVETARQVLRDTAAWAAAAGANT